MNFAICLVHLVMPRLLAETFAVVYGHLVTDLTVAGDAVLMSISRVHCQ